MMRPLIVTSGVDGKGQEAVGRLLASCGRMTTLAWQAPPDSELYKPATCRGRRAVVWYQPRLRCRYSR